MGGIPISASTPVYAALEIRRASPGGHAAAGRVTERYDLPRDYPASSVHTVNFSRVFGPKVVAMAMSAVSLGKVCCRDGRQATGECRQADIHKAT